MASRRSWFLWAFASACVVPAAVVACSSSSGGASDVSDASTPSADGSTTPTGDGAAPVDASSVDSSVEASVDAASGGDAAAACEANAVDGPTVTSTVAAGAPPTMTGGVIADGKYWRTAQARYGGSTGVTMVAERLDITGGGTLVNDGTHEGAVDHRGGFMVTTNGVDFVIHGVCGEFAGLMVTEQYTATPTQLITLTSAGRLTTYTKQ